MVSGEIVLAYHRLYDGRGFSPVRRSWGRYRAFRELIDALDLTRHLRVVEPRLARPAALLPVHPASYVSFVQERDREGTGYLDGKETPAWPGVYDRAMAAVGATLEGVGLIAEGRAAHVFNPSGGLHHAHRERTAGFCIFNDVALAVRQFGALGYGRVAIVDVDGHHGDGTQELLYADPALKISLHQYDGRFFPGSGGPDEVGWGPGFGLNVNVGLPRGVGDHLYVEAFEAIVPHALRDYRPDAIILNFGVDGHAADPLVRLSLTTYSYRRVAEAMHALAHELCAGRLLVLGSGGYDPDAVARCWTVLVAVLSGALPADAGTWPGPLVCLRDESPTAGVPGAAQRVHQTIRLLQESVLPLRLTGGKGTMA